MYVRAVIKNRYTLDVPTLDKVIAYAFLSVEVLSKCVFPNALIQSNEGADRKLFMICNKVVSSSYMIRLIEIGFVM